MVTRLLAAAAAALVAGCEPMTGAGASGAAAELADPAAPTPVAAAAATTATGAPNLDSGQLTDGLPEAANPTGAALTPD